MPEQRVLDRFEEIRYPDHALKFGLVGTLCWNPAPLLPPGIGTEGLPRYQIAVTEIDQFVDVTQVTVGTSMAMEGQPMAGYVTEPARIGRGRYTVQMVLAMSGTWQITIGWSDAAGPKRATFTARIS